MLEHFSLPYFFYSARYHHAAAEKVDIYYRLLSVTTNEWEDEQYMGERMEYN